MKVDAERQPMLCVRGCGLGFFREHFAAIMSLVVDCCRLALYSTGGSLLLFSVVVFHLADDAGWCALNLRHAE